MRKNIMTEAPFTQVCVWPATLVAPDQVAAFEAFMLENFETRVKFLETIHTAPDMQDGYPVEGTGGRADVFFAVHSADISKFAIPRLKAGIRWIEDVLDNEMSRASGSVYPARVHGYRTW